MRGGGISRIGAQAVHRHGIYGIDVQTSLLALQRAYRRFVDLVIAKAWPDLVSGAPQVSSTYRYCVWTTREGT